MTSDKSLADKILSVIAYCGGESTAETLLRLSESHRYYSRVTNELIREKYIRKTTLNEKRCFRITNRGRKKLMDENYDRFYLFCVNAKIKSEIRRRVRYHRLSDINISMLNARIEIFFDNKPNIFASENNISIDFKVPVFYTPKDIRQLEDKNFSNSKVSGIIFSDMEIFFSYHISDGNVRWFQSSENKMFINIMKYINNSNLKNKYSDKKYRTILFGNSIDAVPPIIIEKKSTFINKSIHPVYFLTLDCIGDKMLQILCNPDLKLKIYNIFIKTFKNEKPGYNIECDGLLDGKPAIISYIFELTNLSRFIYILKYHNKNGIIICFDFQKKIIDEITKKINAESNIEIRTISYSKFERSFFNNG